ncbi:MAG: HU family DNA-binding protein [Acidobacteriia bacterium]|nr:HU family DNA-binding protein [Terriglobia bacterium]
MKKNELALRLAQDVRVSPAEAADHLDIALHDIMKKIRNGKQVRLPGLGAFLPGGPHTGFQFNRYAKSKNNRNKKG